MHLTSKQFARAAAIAEEIESLEKQVNDLLQGKEITLQPESSPKAPRTQSVRAPKKIATSAPVARNEERGTLTPAVVRILKRSKKPLRAADIYDALVAQGYPLRAKSRRKSSEFDSTRCQESKFLVRDCFRPSEGRGKYIFESIHTRRRTFERRPPPSYRSQIRSAL